MRVLLLNTPFYRLMGSHYNGLSLGLLYIAAVLRDNGHHVGVLNADHEDRSDYLDQRGVFKGFDLYKKIHEDKNHYIWEQTTKKILEFDPDFIGITMYTANLKAARIIAEKIKKANRHIRVVVGGTHPTLAPHDTLQNEEFDYIIAGEGEYSFLRLVNGEPEEKNEGLGYKKDGTLFVNPLGESFDLDALPFPARDLIIDPSSNIDYGQLVTGRGCPFSCTYCASPAMWSKKSVRFRSVANVIEELISIKENYPYNIIYFEDDTFTLNRKRTVALCKEIVRRELNIRWKCDTRADCLTEELIVLMREAGCVCIKMGVESGSEKILRKINKGVKKETILDVARKVKRHGIPLTIYLMAGFPDETDEDLQETIDFAREIDADYYSLSIVAPYFGTKLYEEFMRNKENKIHKEHWEYFYHQSKEMIINNNLSEERLEEFLSLNDRKIRI